MMKISMLKTVSLCGVRPEILAVRPIVFSCAEQLGCGHLVITAIRDGQHMAGSRHYLGCAEDYDPIGWSPQQIQELCDKIKECISEEYDVVVHANSFHVEYDPKKNTRV